MTDAYENSLALCEYCGDEIADDDLDFGYHFNQWCVTPFDKQRRELFVVYDKGLFMVKYDAFHMANKSCEIRTINMVDGIGTVCFTCSEITLSKSYKESEGVW